MNLFDASSSNKRLDFRLLLSDERLQSTLSVLCNKYMSSSRSLNTVRTEQILASYFGRAIYG
jgi:hypothetical protein